MDKTRIPLNVEPELREMFTERMEAFNDKLSLTQALKSAMYNMTFMTNAELFKFINKGAVHEASMPAYKRLFEQAKKDKFIPESLSLGNPQAKNLYTALIEHYHSEEPATEEETKNKINHVLKVIENADLFIVQEVPKNLKFHDE